MAKTITRVSFDEFSHNLEDYFERVVRDEETIFVEKAEGERVVLSPGPANGLSGRKLSDADYEAVLSTAGGRKGLVDVDQLVENIYDSRSMPPRPRVRLN